MANIPLKSIQFPGLSDTYTVPEIDNTLTAAGKAADAKKTGDEVSALKADLTETDERVQALEQGGSGMSLTAVNLLNTILSEAVYGSDQTENIELLYLALSNVPPVSISAALSDEVTPYLYTPYSDLVFDVTATFDDGSTLVVTNYTVLDGTVVSGTNTATIKFRGLTTQVTFQADTTPVYRITYNLTNAGSSNTAASVVQHDPYFSTLSADEGYFISSCVITMDGVDVTSTVLFNNTISIADVTGDVVITVSAEEYTYVDLVYNLPSGATYGLIHVYSDKNVTPATGIYAAGNTTQTMSTQYPAKNNCRLHYKIKNISEESINPRNFCMGSVDVSDNSYKSSNYLNIAYGVILDNVSHTLSPNDTIEGDIDVKAGYQFVVGYNYTLRDKFEIELTGSFVEDTFSDYAEYALDSLSPTLSPQRTITVYSDDGQTQISSGSSQYARYINTSMEQGTYDMFITPTGDPVSGSDKHRIRAGGIEPTSGTTIDYAFNSETYLFPNLWFHGQLVFEDSGMVIYIGSNGNYSNLTDGRKVTLMLKKVVEP